MTWLYTIVAAGLMLAGGGDTSPIVNYKSANLSNVKTAGGDYETEKFEQTYPLNADGRISVSDINGSITIEVWDKSEVKLEYVKTSDDREALADIAVNIDAKPDYLRVVTDLQKMTRNLKTYGGARRNYNRSDVEYHLTVPRNAVLDEIATVNGSIIISHAANSIKASVVNGEIKATNLRGTINLSTVNGTVEADFEQVAAGGKITLGAVNGTIILTLPSDVNATIKADTVNGKITNDFNLPVRKGQYVGRDLYGKIGSGDVPVKLSSVNGELSVKRKNDGKPLNPAVNLLPQKSKSDRDDDDSDANYLNDATRKALEESRKDAAEALKLAEKELLKNKPDIKNLPPEELEKQINEAARQLETAEMQARLKEAVANRANIIRLYAKNSLIGSPFIEQKSETFTVKNKPKIIVEAENCVVSVRGWDKSEVHYSLTQMSKIRTRTPVDLKAVQNDSNITIKVAGQTGNAVDKTFFNEVNRVRLEIFVPRKSNLKITTGGEIRLEGVSGDIDLRGAAQAVNVRDADGTLRAETGDGRIRVIGFRGAVNAQTTNGAMNFEGDFENLSAQTGSGTIILTLPENSAADIESNRKDIIGEGFALDYQGDGKSTSVWKIGGGGNIYRLYTTADGRVIVRNANNLKAVQ